MTDPIDRARGLSDRPNRRAGQDRRRAAEGEERPDAAFPVPTEQPHAKDLPPPPSQDAAFAAQLLGQPGQKRGLKAGKETIDQARGAYLDREFSGEADRRPPPGLIKKTDI